MNRLPRAHLYFPVLQNVCLFLPVCLSVCMSFCLRMSLSHPIRLSSYVFEVTRVGLNVSEVSVLLRVRYFENGFVQLNSLCEPK